MLYFVYDIKPDKMMELIKTSPHNVNPFKPNFIIKAIKWPGKGEEFSALFYGDENGKINTKEALVLGCVRPESDMEDVWYLHEMTGLIKGYGKIYFKTMLEKYPKAYGEVALIGDGSEETPYQTNEKLLQFYKQFPLTFKRVYFDDFKCERIFMFTKNLSKKEISDIIAKQL